MSINRRDFVKTTMAGSAGLLISGKALAVNLNQGVLGANDQIRVGVIGLNGHAATHIEAYKKMPGVKIVALCDPDSEVLRKRVAELSQENIQVKSFVDLRKLYEDKDIDAVSIVTPNYWHALASIWACQAGKHVCVEKPVSHCIWEGRKIFEAARKYKRLVQADFDMRSSIDIEEGIEYMKKNLGKILLVRIINYKRRTSIGKTLGPGTVPPHVDYDLYTGPVAIRPLQRRDLHYEWHWQWATGNGEIGNNGPHQFDVCRWALGKTTLPKTVMSFGGRYGYVDDGETPNTQVAVYDYDGIPVIFDSRGLSKKLGIETSMDGFSGYSASGKRIQLSGAEWSNCQYIFICENRYFSGTTVYDNDGNIVKNFEKKPEHTGPQFSFIKALRSSSESDLKTDILEGHLSSTLCHMGNISYQIGNLVSVEELKQKIQNNQYLLQVYEDFETHLALNGVDVHKEQIIMGPTLTMDSSKERFIGEHNERANLFIKDTYREPFLIPDKI